VLSGREPHKSLQNNELFKAIASAVVIEASILLSICAIIGSHQRV